ncbi:tripartite tricarboxylate transporter TctB family protein [Terrabacter carboxydivorans]|uniref:Tripartite tricarboxylate transporter TctB family protein n=1 Tax=Terrabacter carboxydivorans TaxID=619730 RepID=A0ABP5Z817_9MICO
MSDTTPDRTHTDTAAQDVETQGGDRAQYGMCAALAGLGIILLVNSAQLAPVASTNDSLGPKVIPTVLGILLLITSVFYAVDIHRGGVGAADEGEDVDLSAKADWKTVGLLVVIFAASAAFMEPLGWVIAGTLLFSGSAYALGNRHVIRGLLVGLAISLATFYAFAIGLGVNLPAGILQGIL